LSYQQAIGLRHSLHEFCERERPIVILDEVHHTEGPVRDRDGNSWGHAVEFSCGPASFKLCTTGTPFREGNNPISFVNYNDNGEAVALVRYTYADAIKDGVCRPIEFTLFEGTVEWDGRTANFSDKLTKKLSRQRLRAALSTDGDFPRTLLAVANEQLEKIRAGTGVDARAGGLVVACDIDHANAISEELFSVSGRRPVLVNSKVDDAHEQINAFREGDDPWIVGINMMSEGVDIPRLRVGVYASNIRAALYFHQFCGRFSRVMESRDERSYVFMPADPELEAIALEIEKYRCHALGEEFRSSLRRIGTGQGRKPRDIQVEGSVATLSAIAVSGNLYSASFVRSHMPAINSFRLKSPRYRHMSDGEVIQIMIDLGVVQIDGAA
jgi:superfamily II DNA or RNA helicase